MALIKQQQPGKGMWPFQTMSLPTASAWADAASLVLLACVICAAVATFILVQTAKVKEQRWSEAAAQAQQQVASLLRELESARTAATEANGRAAAVKDELTRANVAGAPTSAAQPQPAASTGARAEPPKLPGRALSDQQVESLARRMAPFTHQHITVGASPVTLESGRFADQLVVALRAAGVSAERSDSSAGIQIGATHGVVARYVTGNQRSEQFAKSLTEELAADGFAARAMNGLVEEIMQALVKQGRPINDPANEWVVVAIGD